MVNQTVQTMKMRPNAVSEMRTLNTLAVKILHRTVCWKFYGFLLIYRHDLCGCGACLHDQ